MKHRKMKNIAITLIALSLAVLASSNPSWAAGDCQKVKGIETGRLSPDGSGSTGIVTQGGRLNGTSHVLLATPFAITADPYVFSFTDQLTLNTKEGVLRTNNVTLLDMANGVGTAIARIDPNSSEGIFAGATGILYLNAMVTDNAGGFQAEITGEVCYAN